MSSGRDASSSARKMLAIRLVFCTLSRRPSPVAKKRSRALFVNDRITQIMYINTLHMSSITLQQSIPGPRLWECNLTWSATSLTLRKGAKSASFDGDIVFEVARPKRFEFLTPNRARQREQPGPSDANPENLSSRKASGGVRCGSSAKSATIAPMAPGSIIACAVPRGCSRDRDALFLKQANFRVLATASGSLAMSVSSAASQPVAEEDRRQAPLDRGRLDDRRVGHRIGNYLVDQFLQVVDGLDMGSRDKTVLAGNTIAFHDLPQSSQDVRDLLQLSRNGPDAQPSRDWQAQSLRIDRNSVAFDHAGFLQALDPFGHARRRQAD